MSKRIPKVLGVVLILSLLAATTALAATIDPVSRTVTTGRFFVKWSQTDPEEVVDIRWMGSPNLTNTAANPNCAGDLEFFGNSWVSENEGTPDFFFGSLVGWGTTGTWDAAGGNKVNVDSISAGCFHSADLPVTTKYQFFDQGPTANRIRVQRQFGFGATPYAHNVRSYIPRLYPQDAFTQVLHPNAGGTDLLTEGTSGCDFGCLITDWNGTWFAIHDPTLGRGMIVRRGSTSPALLRVDIDDASFTNASSVQLLQPAGGFTGNVTEVEFLCFYDSSIWAPSIALPPGC